MCEACKLREELNKQEFNVDVSIPTGLLLMEQYGKDAIEITREEALHLAAYILKNFDRIATNKEFYGK